MKKKQTKKKMYKVNKKKGVLVIAGLVCLLVAMVTYRFIEFSQKDVVQNNERPGGVSYRITPSDQIVLTNVYPISSEELMEDTQNNKSLTINISGSTNYDEDMEYLIKFDQVDNAINGKIVPIAYMAAYSNIGSESADYFNDRGKNDTIFQITESGLVYSNEVLLVGYIRKGEVNFNGNVTVTAYVDSSKIDVFGEEEEYGDIGDYYFPNNEGVAPVVNFTPEEWDEIMSRGVSFKVRVEMKNGIWVNN